eukprot:275319-Pelagomonas_calceolata.AAC.1
MKFARYAGLRQVLWLEEPYHKNGAGKAKKWRAHRDGQGMYTSRGLINKTIRGNIKNVSSEGTFRLASTSSILTSTTEIKRGRAQAAQRNKCK